MIGTKNKLKILLSICLIALVIIQVFLITQDNKVGANEIKSMKTSAQRALIQNMITSDGAKNTLLALEKIYEGSEDAGHNILHLYGEELYEIEGDDGILICNSEFGFGCYHGFSTQALSVVGTEVLPGLDEACKSAGELHLACAHGLGHGALEYFGRTNLLKALNACRTLDWKGKLYGCQDGVFMEYNFPNILVDKVDTPKARLLDVKNPYDPCDTIPEDFKNACFYSLGQWWSYVTDNDYEVMGNFCKGLENIDSRNSCYLGIGNDTLADSGYDPARIIEICQSLGDDKSGELICRLGAYIGLSGKEGHEEKADKICEDLDDSDRKKCVDYSIVQRLKE